MAEPLEAAGEPALPVTRVRKQRAFEQVIDQLEDLILRGELRAGDRLPPERVLSEQFDISRHSLREALRALEAVGILRTPGSGRSAATVVTNTPGDSLFTILRLQLALSHFPARDFLEVREILETWTVRRAAATRTADDLDRLRELLRSMATQLDEREAFSSIDAAFHVELAELAGNQLASYLMRGIRDAMTLEILELGEVWGDWRSLAEVAHGDHTRIVDAIEAGDGDAAARVIHEHFLTYGGPGSRPPARVRRRRSR